jgi:hypothetical protein
LVVTESNPDPLTDKIFYSYSVEVWKPVDIYEYILMKYVPSVCGQCF